jgi:hypothetical protein
VTQEATVSTTDESPPRDASGRFTSAPEPHTDGPPWPLPDRPPGPPPVQLTDDPHYREAGRTPAGEEA